MRTKNASAIAAVGGIVWRIAKRNDAPVLQVLLGRRAKDPDKDRYTLCFGGEVALAEGSMGIMRELHRKLREETGAELHLTREAFLGAYGPRDFRRKPILSKNGKLLDWKQTREVVKSSTMITVFSVHWAGGEPLDNKAVKDLMFVDAFQAANLWEELAFDQGHMLIDLARAVHK